MTDKFEWGEGDEIIAHGMLVALDAKEMQRLMVCTCEPRLFGGTCILCGRNREPVHNQLGNEDYT